MPLRFDAAKRREVSALLRDRDTDRSSGFVGAAVDDGTGVGAGMLAVGNFNYEDGTARVGTTAKFRAERIISIGGEAMPDMEHEARGSRAQIERHAFCLLTSHHDMR